MLPIALILEPSLSLFIIAHLNLIFFQHKQSQASMQNAILYFSDYGIHIMSPLIGDASSLLQGCRARYHHCIHLKFSPPTSNLFIRAFIKLPILLFLRAPAALNFGFKFSLNQPPIVALSHIVGVRFLT